ncbi:hypothetical protein D9615_003442 [Tricholomella constricta]|uniref:G domain-containing protein n=1 Tax=Tricholomella constricta TaxID=117010 RepID=A0A8H5HJ38_9AGAR|nr:hypothetical protein D9615_003442 [Tricholomella constricta]
MWGKSKPKPEAAATELSPAADEYKVQAEDTIFLILGQSGAGKSTFINHAIGEHVASVGENLSSHTVHIRPYSMTLDSGRRIVLVDTPGFNDTYASDREIMQRIIDWLSTRCSPKMKFAGIIYLHEIIQTRTDPETNLMHPTKLSKPEAPKYVILVTVKWKEMKDPESVGKLRETQLKAQWKKMSDHGSQMSRFEDTTESARAIIDMFQVDPIEVEEIQEELRRILALLPPQAADRKDHGEGFISKLFGKLTNRRRRRLRTSKRSGTP